MSEETPLKVVQGGDFGDDDQLVIRPLASSRDLFAVYRLAEQYYKSKGVTSPHPDGLWAAQPDFDHSADTTVLVAFAGEEVAGSVSITRDGLKGLTIDRHFGRTCALIRGEGRRIGEIWRLALKGSASEQAQIAAELLRRAMALCVQSGVQTCLLSLHPDHVDQCNKLFNVITLIGGQLTPGAGALSLPTVLMRCDTEQLPESLSNRTKAAS